MSFRVSAVDDEELVHEAVRRGHVISLEVYLTQNTACINKVYEYDRASWTPLLAACFYKRRHIVHMLLTRFKPNIEAVGTITVSSIDNRSDLAEEVSPLWAAAAVNEFDIVKLLVEKGHANVNHLIKTHSTPLRAACYHNNLEMVKYLIEHNANPHKAKKGNFTNLMLCAGRRYLPMVRYLVDEITCDVNEQDENGQTALYYAVRSGSSEITRFLLERGALNIRDKQRKVTPLMRAALFGEPGLVDVFRDYCSDLEWIEAKELLATSFAGCISHIEDIKRTLEYLTEAFELRLAKNLPKNIVAEPLEVLRYRRECETLEQLNQLLASNAKEALHIEAILIHQRLLGNDQNDYHDVIHYYGAGLARNRQYHDCFRVWFYEFELKKRYNMTFQNDYLNHFISLFAKMKLNDRLDIPIEYLVQMFNIMDHVLKSDQYKINFDTNFIVLLHLVTLVARIIYSDISKEKQNLSHENYRALYKSMRHVIRCKYRTLDTGSSLLHLCTSSLTESALFFEDYPCWMTTRLLIACNMDVNTFDFDGNTPLHKIAQSASPSEIFKFIDLLCNAGAHLDYVNKKQQTPLDIVSPLPNKVIHRIKEKMDMTRLKCFCARLIRQQRISCQHLLSARLTDFIQNH